MYLQLGGAERSPGHGSVARAAAKHHVRWQLLLVPARRVVPAFFCTLRTVGLHMSGTECMIIVSLSGPLDALNDPHGDCQSHAVFLCPHDDRITTGWSVCLCRLHVTRR